MASLRVATKCPQCTIRFFDAALASSGVAIQQQWTTLPRRHFTTSTYRSARVAPGRIMPRQRQPSQESLRVRIKKEQERLQADMMAQGVPENIGILPDTFVLPEKNNWNRTIRWMWLKTRFRHLLAAFWLKFDFRKDGIDWQYRSINTVADQFYNDMSSWLAKGHVTFLRNITMPALFQQLQRKISERGSDERYEWSEVQTITPPKLVSFFAMPSPDPVTGSLTGSGNAVLQAIVRIHQIQRLQRQKPAFDRFRDRADWVPNGPAREKEVVEYIVMTRLIKDRTAGPWRIYGFYQPKTTEQILAEAEEAKTRLAYGK